MTGLARAAGREVLAGMVAVEPELLVLATAGLLVLVRLAQRVAVVA